MTGLRPTKGDYPLEDILDIIVLKKISMILMIFTVKIDLNSYNIGYNEKALKSCS
jgi:hypothetical protein